MMSITSIYFLVFVLLGVCVYYICPKKIRWIWLLILSIAFYYESAKFISILYIVSSALIAYCVTMLSDRIRLNKKDSHIPFVLTVTAIILIVGIWFFVKGRELWGLVLSKISYNTFSTLLDMELLAALGMGYYTLQITGYVIDCYWESIKVQKNPLKLLLFTLYFPQLITGPISRYSQLESLFEGHAFKYRNITFGSQRILWGFIKKLVLASRAGLIVDSIFMSPDSFHGFYSWVVILIYPIQMYADFSGCMDIVAGVSELFGITLPENFNNPFFSRTSQEFWQRWHITLGAWAKDYVLYPILKSRTMVKFGKFTRKLFNKSISKFMVNLIAMFFLWLVMGIWHGGLKYIVGVSLWYWIVMMLGEAFTPLFSKIVKLLMIKTESFSWHLFQSCRTYLIYATGAIFFYAGVRNGLNIISDAIKVFYVKDYANPWIFFDGSILNIVSHIDINIMIFVIFLLFVVAALREKYGYARVWIEKQGFLFRWAIWLSLFAFVLIWGIYGPGYDASEFIYRGF